MDTDLLFRGYLGKRVHLGVTGSVAAYKAIDLVRGLLDCNVSVSATLTDAAAKFVTPLSFAALGADPVYGAMFADGDDPYAHLGPGRAADVLAVAPCTANSLAKFANGLADDMLSCQVLAHAGPLLLAPAMNPAMWEAPATKANVARLRERGAELVFPGSREGSLRRRWKRPSGPCGSDFGPYVPSALTAGSFRGSCPAHPRPHTRKIRRGTLLVQPFHRAHGRVSGHGGLAARR